MINNDARTNHLVKLIGWVLKMKVMRKAGSEYMDAALELAKLQYGQMDIRMKVQKR